MAGNLTADDSGGPNPTVTFDANGATVTNDWRMRVDTGTMALQRNDGSLWYQEFAWTTSGHTSGRNLEIATSEPTLTFTDTSTSEADVRFRADNGALYLEKDGGAGFGTFFSWGTSEITSDLTLKVRGTAPSITLEDTTTSAHDFRMTADSNTLTFEGNDGAWATLSEWTTTLISFSKDVRIINGAPRLVFEDNSGGQPKFRFKSDNATLSADVDSGSGYATLFEWTSSGIAANVDLTLRSTAPTLYFADTTGSATQFRMKADANKVTLESDSGSGYSSMFEWTSGGATSKVDLKIENGSPTLEFADTTGGAVQFHVKADADKLSVDADSGSGYQTVFQWSVSGVTAKQNVVVSTADPSITLVDTTLGDADFRMSAEGDVFAISADDASSGSFTPIFEADTKYAYARKGFASGHDSAGGGANHAIRWKKKTGYIDDGQPGVDYQVGSGYFIVDLFDIDPDTNNPDLMNVTVGVLVMLSTSNDEDSVFQVHDWRYTAATSPTGFHVEVIYARDTTNDIGDRVKVTYDPARYDSSDSKECAWRILAFFDPAP